MIIKIPVHLQKEEYRFVLLGKWDEYKNKKTKEIKNFYPKTKIELKKISKEWHVEGKRPQESAWQTVNNYRYDDPKLLNHIAAGNNYGVLCGPGNLRVLDVDNLEIAKELIKKLPITFTIRTGSGGLHFYFISDYCKNEILTCGEMRCLHMQVVGPGSIHPISNPYILEDEN